MLSPNSVAQKTGQEEYQKIQSNSKVCDVKVKMNETPTMIMSAPQRDKV
jgi:hypothetical protein